MRLRTLSIATLLAGCLALTLVPTNAFADDQAPKLPEGVTESGDSYVIQSPVEVEAFLRALDALVDAEVTWDPGDKAIRGKRIQAGRAITFAKDSVLDDAKALLTFYDLVVVEVGKKTSKRGPRLLVMDARRTSAILKLKAEYVTLTPQNLETYAHRDGHYITTSIPVVHMADMRSARAALTRIVTSQNIGNVTEVTDGKTFIVTDFAPNVVAIYKLVKSMDEAARSTTNGLKVKTVELKHGRAVEVSAALTALFAQKARTAVNPRNQPYPLATRAAVRVIADARTNTITLRGLAEQVEQALVTLERLDADTSVPSSGPPAASAEYDLIVLQHADVEETASVLMNMLRARHELMRDASGTPPNVTASPETDGLLVSASPKTMKILRTLIAQIDSAAEKASAK